MPGVSTPTAQRSRSPSAGSPGNSDAVCASGPRPRRIRSSAGTSSLAERRAQLLPRRRRRRSCGPSSPSMPWTRRAAGASIRSSSASLDHAVVRELVVGRDAAVVAEPEASRRPVQAASRPPLVGAPRRRAARERDVPAAPADGGEPLGRGLGQGRRRHGRPVLMRADHVRRPRAARAVGRVAQQRLADALAEDARPRRARRRAPSTSDSSAVARAPAWRAGRPSRGRATATCPDAVSTVSPARPGRAHRRIGLEAQLDVLAAAARAGRAACRPGRRRARLPAEPRRQPAEEQQPRRSPSRGGGGR